MIVVVVVVHGIQYGYNIICIILYCRRISCCATTKSSHIGRVGGKLRRKKKKFVIFKTNGGYESSARSRTKRYVFLRPRTYKTRTLLRTRFLSCRRALVVPMRRVNARNGSYILYCQTAAAAASSNRGERCARVLSPAALYTRIRYGLRARAPARIGGGGGGVRTNLNR